MDCDDVELALARGDARGADFAAHLATCVVCRQLATVTAADDDDNDRWLVQVSEDALDDPDLLVLPTVDPIVFTDEHELARGGMGRITRVHDRRLGRDVAIKEVLDPAMRARFEREVAITAQLQHPAIVPIYEAGTWPDGSAFYTMRLVSGGTLGEAIAAASTYAERLALLPHVLALTDALAYAHSRGIVHRDLKPGNVLVGEFGETVVIDWGLAKEIRRTLDDDRGVRSDIPSARGLTRVGAIIGTPGFMAPEQAAGLTVDERADVYALGAILYSLIAGVPPYSADGDEALAQQRAGAPPSLEKVSPESAPDLRAIVDKAMAREPTDRYPSAKELADELRRFEAGQMLASRTYSSSERLARWVRRHRAIVSAGAIAAALVTTIGIGAIVNVARSRTRAETSVTTLLEEQGRAELVAGEPERAATLLSLAYVRGDRSTAVRQMLASSTRDLGAQGPTVTLDTSINALGFRADGTIVTVDMENIAIWTDGKQTRSHRVISYAPDFNRLSPDASQVAIAGDGDQVELHDVVTGNQLWAAPAARDGAIRFVPGGKTVLLARFEHATELRDLATGALIATLPGAISDDGLAVSPDGSVVALCTGKPGDAVIADAHTGAVLSTHPGCWDRVALVDAKQLLVQTSTRELQLMALSGAPPVPLAGNAGAITSIVVDAVAHRIVATDDVSTLTLWDTTGARIATAATVATTPVFSHDGRFLAARGVGEPLRIWTSDALHLVHVYHPPPADRPYSTLAIAWSADDKQVATLDSGDRRVLTYRPGSGARVWRGTEHFQVSRDLLVGGAAEDHLAVRALGDGGLVRELPFDGAMYTVVDVSRSGDRALIHKNGGGELRVIDTHSGATLSMVIQPSEIGFAALSPDGAVLIESSEDRPDGSQIQIRDASTGTVLQTAPANRDVATAGDRFAVAVAEGIELRSIKTGALIKSVPLDRGGLHVAFDPSGTTVIGYGGISHPRVIDARDGHVIAELSRAASSLEFAAFNASGDRLLTWGNDRSAQLWNMKTGALLATIDGVAQGAIAITDDALRFATATDAGDVQVWDATTHRLLETLPATPGGVRRLVWNRDGTRLVAQGPDSTTIWDVHLESRAPAEIAAIVRQASGWTVVDGLLVPASASFH